MRSWGLNKSYSICNSRGLPNTFIHVYSDRVKVTSWSECVKDWISEDKKRSTAAKYFKTARENGLKTRRI